MRFKVLKYWKQGLVFLNSFLLAFQPAVYALNSDSMGRMKTFIETSEITKREVTVKELYEKFSGNLPAEMRHELKAIATEFPDLRVPQMNVSKIKGENGEEDVQLQFVKDKMAGVITLIGRGQVFAKVGSSTIMVEDIVHSEKALTKLAHEFPDSHGVPAPVENKKATSVQFLSWNQVSRFSPKERDLYLRRYAEALTAAEAVQNARLAHLAGSQVSSKDSLEDFDKYQAFLDIFVPKANAEDNTTADGAAAVSAGLKMNESCIYAGNLMDYGCRHKVVANDPQCKKSGGLICGGVGSNSSKLMSNMGENGLGCKLDSGGRGIKCFAPLYGTKCVTRDDHATKSCGDDPQVFKCESLEQFEKFKKEVKDPLEKQLKWCGNMKQYMPSKFLPDQQEACGVLDRKVKIINDTSSCVNGAATPQKKADCVKEGSTSSGGGAAVNSTGADGVGAKTETAVAQPNTNGGTGGASSGVAGEGRAKPGKCEEKDWFKDEAKHKKSECSNSGTLVTCESDSAFWKCDCGPAKPGVVNSYTEILGGPAYSCNGSAVVDNGGTDSSAKSEKKDKCAGVMGWLGCNKRTVGLISLFALLAVAINYSQRQQLDAYYQFTTPKPTATPMTTLNKGTR